MCGAWLLVCAGAVDHNRGAILRPRPPSPPLLLR